MFNTMSNFQSLINHSQVRGDLALFKKAFANGRRGQIRAAILQNRYHLLPIDEIVKGRDIQSRAYRGLVSVQIKKIIGSESCSDDFDRAFNPLKKHNMHRWMGIASAWMNGKGLPAVELIQIGDRFIVRDGHHRISVARALGVEFIDANVTVWKLKPLG